MVLSRFPRVAGMNSAYTWHTMSVIERGFEFDLGVSLGHFLEARFLVLIYSGSLAIRPESHQQLPVGTLYRRFSAY